MLVVLIRVSTWLQFVVVNDLSGQMLTFDGVWHFGEVFSSRINPRFSLYRGDDRQRAWRCVGERCILNAQRYRDEILRAIVVPFIHDYHLMLQHDSALQHYQHMFMLQGSGHNSWKLKTSQFLHGQHTHRTCHPLSMLNSIMKCL